MIKYEKIAITQPNYFPWLGYFDLMNNVYLWISLDDVKLSKRSYVVRNKILSPSKKRAWITVNLKKRSSTKQINESYLADNKWWIDHINKIESYYRTTPYFERYIDKIRKIIIPKEKILSCYNERIVKNILELLDIKIAFIKSSEIDLKDTESIQDRIVQLCNKFGASEYYNFKNGVEAKLYEPTYFKKCGIEIYKQEYNHPKYNQHQTNGNFIPYMSILDLIFNEGEKALSIIKSGENWINMTKEINNE